MGRRLVLFASACVLVLALAAQAQEGAPPPPAAAADDAASAPAPTAQPATTSAAPPAAPPATTPAATPAAPAAPAPAAAPAAPSPASTAAVPAAPLAPPTADEEYDVKMRELEDMVSELKEQIFRSKAKLQLLAEQVAGGVGVGAKIVIVHKNQMGQSFLLTEANYYLDGQPLWQEVDESGAKLTEKREVPVWDGNIVEGSHTLTVNLVYKGNGTGVFRYLSAYKWTLKDNITFTAEPGKVVTIESVGFEKGNFTTPTEERPAIRFDINTSRDTRVDKKGQGTTP
jgi:hypothetical protein